MAEHVGDGGQVGAAADEGGGEGVAADVGGDVLFVEVGVGAARASEEADSWLHGMRVGQSLPQLRPPDIGALAQQEL